MPYGESVKHKQKGVKNMEISPLLLEQWEKLVLEEQDSKQTQSDSDVEIVEETLMKKTKKRQENFKKKRKLQKSVSNSRLRKVVVKKRTEKGVPKKMAEKRKKITDKIVTRQSPYQLVSILKNLTARQQKNLKEIGFECMSGFNIKLLPMSLALLIVDRLDAPNCEIMVGGTLTKITKQDVNEILGFPMGNIPVKSVKRAGVGDNNFRMSWKRRYPCPKKGGQRIYLTDVKEMIQSNPEGGSNFKLDILLAIMTIMGEGISCGTVNQRVLASIQIENDIKNMDWCGYVLECLKKSKDKWSKDDERSWYTGPLAFLVVWYAQKISKQKKRTPAILNWTCEELKTVEEMEISKGESRSSQQPIQNSSMEIEEFNELTPIRVDDSKFVGPSEKREEGDDFNNEANRDDGEAKQETENVNKFLDEDKEFVKEADESNLATASSDHTGQVFKEGACPEKVDSTLDRSLKSVMTNGVDVTGNEGASVDREPSKKPEKEGINQENLNKKDTNGSDNDKKSKRKDQASKKRGKEVDTVINSTEPMVGLAHKRAGRETSDQSAKKSRVSGVAGGSSLVPPRVSSSLAASGHVPFRDMDVTSLPSPQMFLPGASTPAMEERVRQMCPSSGVVDRLEGMANESAALFSHAAHSIRALEEKVRTLNFRLTRDAVRQHKRYEEHSKRWAELSARHAAEKKVSESRITELESLVKAKELENSELKKQLDEWVCRDKGYDEKISVLEREVADLKSLDEQMKLSWEVRAMDAERRAAEAEKRLAEAKRKMVEAEGTVKAALASFAL